MSATVQILITAAGKLSFGVGLPSSTSVYNSNTITGVQAFDVDSAPPHSPSVMAEEPQRSLSISL